MHADPYPSDRPLAVAHRGGGGLAPENTLAAFDRAVELGADVLELDLHLTRDGVPVACHDPTIDRTTDGTGAIADLPLARIREHDAGHCFTPDGATFPFRGRGLVVPTLAEILARYPDARFSLEVKAVALGAVEPIAALVHEHGATARICVGSFLHPLTRCLRRALPGIATHASRLEIVRLLQLQRAGLIRLHRTPARVFTLPETSGGRRVVTERIVRHLRKRGRHVHVWTVNEEADMRRLLDLGVTGLVTDRPDRALRVIRDRGA